MPRFLTPLLCFMVLSSVASANEGERRYPLEPQLQIESGLHTGPIRDLEVNVTNNTIFTASEDKTMRVWSLDSGKLVYTMRVPVGAGPEGELHALAVAPDLSDVLLTGHTGLQWDGLRSLYLARPIDEKLRGRIQKLPVPILKLAYTFDGKGFVAGLDHGRGIGLFDGRTGDYLRISNVGLEDGYITALDTGRTGRIAAAASTGALRVYDDDLAFISEGQAPSGDTPGAIAFSPDGEQLAVVYRESTVVEIRDATTLKVVRRIDAAKSDAGGFFSVAWSQREGDTVLFAGGSLADDSNQIVIRRILPGDGSTRDIPVARDIVTDLETSGEGVVFSTGAGRLGRLEHSGTLAFVTERGSIDFRNANKHGFGVEDDVLILPMGSDGNAKRFNIRTLSMQDAKDDLRSRHPSAKVHPDLADWRLSTEPTLKGKRIDLDDEERSLSTTSRDGGKRVIIGGDFNLRWISEEGELRAKLATPSAVWALADGGKADRVVAALGDGTVRWYELDEAGEPDELVALFLHPDGVRWVAWTPEGFFAHSDLGGQDLVGYAINNENPSQSPHWRSFKQLYRLFHRPDVVQSQLDGEGRDLSMSALDELGTMETVLNASVAPAVEIVAHCDVSPEMTRGLMLVVNEAAPEEPGTPQNADAKPPIDEDCVAVDLATRGLALVTDSGQAGKSNANLPPDQKSIRLRVSVADLGGGIGDVDIILNGRNVSRQSLRGLMMVGAPEPETGSATEESSEPAQDAAADESGPETILFDRVVPLDVGENVFVMRAYNAHGIFSESKSVRFFRPAPAAPSLPTLHVLAVGIDKYRSEQVPALNFAVADAEAVAAALKSQGDLSHYGAVNPISMKDLSLEELEGAFDELAEIVDADDAVIIYLAGHGVLKDDIYYYLTTDVVDGASIKTGGLSHPVLIEKLSHIPARNMFVMLDTCYAGGFNFREHANIANESGRLMLAASTNVQEALDSYNGKNGVFAYAVLEGLLGQAAFPGVKVIDASELGLFVRRRVPQLALKVQHSQTAEFRTSGGGTIVEFPVARVD